MLRSLVGSEMCIRDRLSSTCGAPRNHTNFRPWTHTSDDSYIYQLSLVLATAIVSFLCMILYSQFSVVLPLYGPARRHSIMEYLSIVQCSRFFRQHAAAAVVAFRTCTEETVNRQQARCQWDQAPSVGVARTYTGGCGRYTVSTDLTAEEGKMEPTS